MNFKQIFSVFMIVTIVASAKKPPKNEITEKQIIKIIRESRERQTQKMCMGSNNCCNINSKCGLGEGDCDSNVECEGAGHAGLVCLRISQQGQGSCVKYATQYLGYLPKGFSSTDDCCVLKADLRKYFKYHGEDIMRKIDG